ncbi:MAG: electron transfer flavoprotein subunit alpha/FixB family protein [Thermovirgaceae bacterium]|nr:electron transfer flavoprotein subunit alpha/FixB family protein [Thermovirgaceae bacterium]
MSWRGILVIGEVRSGAIQPATMELTAKARVLADADGSKVTTLLMFDDIVSDPKECIGYGADTVVFACAPAFGLFNQDIQYRTVVHLIEKIRPAIVLASATSAGRTIMPAAAAVIGTGLTADCTGLEIDPENGDLLQTRPAIGGNVMATIRTSDHRPQMATVRPRTFPIPDPDQKRKGKAERLDVPPEILQSRVLPMGIEIQEGEGSNIQDMDVVVSGGKGMARTESFGMLHELASLLGGGIGASRAAVDNRWIGYPHQVGLSGKAVSPKVYIAAGISGSVQHLAGIQTAGYIVAVNKDPDASIFRVADLALCGDLFEIVPKMIEAVKRETEK